VSHEWRHNYERDVSPALVFEVIEPDRPKVYRAVLAFLKSEALHPADFTIREDGVVRLNPSCIASHRQLRSSRPRARSPTWSGPARTGRS
jgi:hypothetical protein